MEVLGYVASFFIGISLGMVGGGGSILTVPVLVYLFGVSPLTATSYSLLVVGITSLAGSVQGARHRMIEYRTGLLFGSSSIITILLVRKVLLPAIPRSIYISHYHLPFEILTMLLFALLMLAASFSMVTHHKEHHAHTAPHHRSFKLVLTGIGIGLITGFLGAGGGFLLIPALVLMLGLPMRKAIGTSLFIITINSLVGFIADHGMYHTNYNLLLAISGLAIAGVIAGGLLSHKVHTHVLKVGFGWFVMAMGCFVLVKELLALHAMQH